jgi:hypothetical protein
MISKCANPACTAHFLYLHEGKLFRVLRGSEEALAPQMGVDPTVRKHVQRVEFFWLCSNCSTRMTVRYEKGVGVVVRPLAIAFRAAS